MDGALAQLVERHNGIVEVSGSIPLCSTTSKNPPDPLIKIQKSKPQRRPSKRIVTQSVIVLFARVYRDANGGEVPARVTLDGVHVPRLSAKKRDRMSIQVETSSRGFHRAFVRSGVGGTDAEADRDAEWNLAPVSRIETVRRAGIVRSLTKAQRFAVHDAVADRLQARCSSGCRCWAGGHHDSKNDQSSLQ